MNEFGYAEFSGNVYFFCFRAEIPCSGKFGPKYQNYKFKLKYAEFNGDAHFFCLDWKYTFWVNLVQKINIISLS